MEARVSIRSLVLVGIFQNLFISRKKWRKVNRVQVRGISFSNSNWLYKYKLMIIRPRRFYQWNNLHSNLFSFRKSAVLSLFRNRRFCLIFEIGGFVSFSESGILSHLKSALLPCPRSKPGEIVQKNWWWKCWYQWKIIRMQNYNSN